MRSDGAASISAAPSSVMVSTSVVLEKQSYDNH